MSLVQVIMGRDRVSQSEAERMIDACKSDLQERLSNGEMPFDICEEHFGLEPDYLLELL